MTNKQITLATAGFERYSKTTRRAQFLDEMDQVIPWKRICQIVERHYPVGEGPGRPPIGVERMLRIYFLQHWFNLSDPGVEEALYDSNAMRAFVGIDLGRERVPDETTVCKFRHLLETHRLGKRIFKAVNAHLARSGMTVGRGTIVVNGGEKERISGGEKRWLRRLSWLSMMTLRLHCGALVIALSSARRRHQERRLAAASSARGFLSSPSTEG